MFSIITLQSHNARDLSHAGLLARIFNGHLTFDIYITRVHISARLILRRNN